MTAEALAAELEVSVRTVYRDIEALHGAGVPLHGEPGHDGGYRLLPGYRTQLTGLTGDEAAALGLSMLPAAAADLGLGPAAAGAATKLRAALTDDLRARADHVQQRLHIDLPNWYAGSGDHPLLVPVADAVWRQHRLRVGYRRWKAPQEVTRTLEPLGLVLKGGLWYVVARVDGQVRTYKVANLLSAASTGERFDRPDGFDLAAHWQRYLDDFAERRHTGTATVRLSAAGPCDACRTCPRRPWCRRRARAPARRTPTAGSRSRCRSSRSTTPTASCCASAPTSRSSPRRSCGPGWRRPPGRSPPATAAGSTAGSRTRPRGRSAA